MNKDYVSAHLSWLKAHPTFQTHLYDNSPPYSSYEQMNIWYTDIQKYFPEKVQGMARSYLEKDLKAHMGINDLVEQMKQEIKAQTNTRKMFFVTIGFNHQTWSVDVCKKVIDRVISLPWVLACKANFELFRENGEHPHCHFLILSDLPKSKILEKLWAVKDIKKVVLKKTFIDIKKGEQCHLKYIMLDKQEDKMSYVDKDRAWRKENQIPDYEKNPADLGI